MVPEFDPQNGAQKMVLRKGAQFRATENQNMIQVLTPNFVTLFWGSNFGIILGAILDPVLRSQSWCKFSKLLLQ